jgi:uncharacterized protein
MIIDAFEFARKGLEASGSLAIEQLERLDVLERSGSLEWRATGSCDADGRPFLGLAVKGKLVLACQRCLEPMVHEVNVGSQLLLARDEAQAAAVPLEELEFDAVVGSERFDLGELIEDEIILSLPLVPKHDRCKDAQSGWRAEDHAASEQVALRTSPFAGLAGAKRGNERS